MKTANEMRKATNPCTMSLKEKSRAEALEYIEKHFMPEIEKTAKMGLSTVQVRINFLDISLDARSYVKPILIENGYRVKRVTDLCLIVSWW